jgi:competence protein ComEC
MLAGVIAACWIAAPSVWGIALLLSALLATGCARRSRPEAGPVGAFAALLLGGWLAASMLAAQLDSRLGDTDAGARLLVTARFLSLPGYAGGEWRADAEVTVHRPAPRPAGPRRLRLSGPLGPHAPRAGETWQLVIATAPARARLNPGGFDLERQWALERIDGFGRVVDSPLNRRLAGSGPGLLALRERIRAALAAQPADREMLALVTALAIGDTAAMTREQWRVFAATGTTHLVAISGLHVTLFAWLVGVLARPLWRLVRPLQRLRRETFALPAGVVAAFCYSLLAGFSIPTQRTVLMLAVVAAARLSGRVLRPVDVLGAACIGVLLLDPLAPLDVGFWLSFGAIWALMVHDSRATPAPALPFTAPSGRLAAALREQLWIGAALAPLTLLLFGTVSVAGWVANPLAIPVFSFVLVPLSLLAAAASVVAALAPVADACLAAAAAVHQGTWLALRAVAGQSWALWAVELPAAWFVLATLALAIATLPLPARMRASALLCALPVVASASAGPAAGEARLTILDVGEGGAVIVQTRHHALLYGTGAAWGSDGAAVEQHVLPALRAARIARLDALVLPRASAAEVQGSARLLRGMPVRQVLAGGEWRDPPTVAGHCPPRLAWRWDGVRFELFAAPLAAGPGMRAQGGCVLRIGTAAGSALLVGSATLADLGALRDPAAGVAPQLAADVLIGAMRAVRSPAQREFTRVVAPGWWVATRRIATDADLAALAHSQGMESQRLLSPSRHGALVLHLTRSAPPNWARATGSRSAPAWRLPRLLPPRNPPGETA